MLVGIAVSCRIPFHNKCFLVTMKIKITLSAIRLSTSSYQQTMASLKTRIIPYSYHTTPCNDLLNVEFVKILIGFNIWYFPPRIAFASLT